MAEKLTFRLFGNKEQTAASWEIKKDVWRLGLELISQGFQFSEMIEGPVRWI